MATGVSDFPTSLDTTSNQPAASTLASIQLDGDGTANNIHSNVHGVSDTAIVALETKLGTGATAPTATAVLVGSGSGTSAWDTTPVFGAVSITDNLVLGIGTSNDGAIVNRTTVLNANTALAGVTIGTPVTPAVAANSTIVSNITASGDILVATNRGGNSEAHLWLDGSAGDTYLYARGVQMIKLVGGGGITVSTAMTLSSTLTGGVDGTGVDVKLYGDSPGAYMEWDFSADQLRLIGPTADAAGSSGKLLLATGQVSVEAADILGQIDFQAPLETQGGDGALVTASIQAVAEATFTATVNNTNLVFKTADDGAATEKFRMTHDGELGIGGANYGTDGQVLTSAGPNAPVAWEAMGTLPLAGGTMTGNITLTDSSVSLDSGPTDETVSGITATFTAGEALVRGEVCYFKAGDSKMWKAVATAAATSNCVAMAAADIAGDAAGLFLLKGFLADNGTFPAYTIAGTLYTPEAATSGENVPEQAAPDTDGDFVQVLGWAVTANSVYFDPDSTIVEVS